MWKYSTLVGKYKNIHRWVVREKKSLLHLCTINVLKCHLENTPHRPDRGADRGLSLELTGPCLWCGSGNFQWWPSVTLATSHSFSPGMWPDRVGLGSTWMPEPPWWLSWTLLPLSGPFCTFSSGSRPCPTRTHECRSQDIAFHSIGSSLTLQRKDLRSKETKVTFPESYDKSAILDTRQLTVQHYFFISKNSAREVLLSKTFFD